MNRIRKLVASLTVFLLIFGNMTFAYACHYNFRFIKVDDSGASMTSASFPDIKFSLEKATDPSGSNPAAWTWTSVRKSSSAQYFNIGDSTGQVSISGTVYFRMKEVHGADGYEMDPNYRYYFIKQGNSTPHDVTLGGITFKYINDNAARVDVRFENKRLGKLTIEKAFPAGSQGNPNDTFSFSVTRQGDSTNYAAGKTAKVGAPIQLDNLPWGTYTITENSKNGYRLTGWSGGTLVDGSDVTKGVTVKIGTSSGAKLNYTVSATNDADNDGKITINKDYPSGSLGNPGDTFSFTVTRQGDSTNYAAGKTAKVGTPMVLDDLPWGTYTITENSKDGYKLSGWTGGTPVDAGDVTKGVTVKIGSGSGASLSYSLTATNRTDNVGKLTIQKAYPAGSLGEADDTFSFTVTRNEDTASPKTNYAAGKTATITTPIVLENLPWGTYTVVENAKTGYKLTGWTGGALVDSSDITKGVTVKVGAGGADLTATVKATNDTSDNGHITIQKAFAAGSLGTAGDTFSFIVTRDEDTASPKTNYASGKTATISSPIELDNLPRGTYTITEVSKNGYRLTNWTGGTLVDAGDIAKGVKVKIGTGSGASLSYTVSATNDTKDVGKLTIQKAFPTGSMGSAGETFSFVVTRNEDTASPKPNYAAGKTATITTPIVLENLPWGTYTITEDPKSNYRLTGWAGGTLVNASDITKGVTVKIGTGSGASLTATAKATNDTVDNGQLTINKAFLEGFAGDSDDTFSFVVTRNEDTASPKTNYASGRTAKVGSPIVLEDLPWGTYTITEAAKDGYRLNAWNGGTPVDSSNVTKGVTVKIGSGSGASLTYSLTAINGSDDVGKLTINKAFPAGSMANANETFSFTVTRNEDTASPKTNYASGKTAKVGAPIVLENLPWGTYTITENAKNGYRLTGWTGGTLVDASDITKGVSVKIGSGSGASLNYALTATNDTDDVGKLTIQKAFPAGSMGDADDTFSFIVTRDEDTASPKTNYAAGRTAKIGSPVMLENLPWGTYTITEDAKDGYELTGWTGGTPVDASDITKGIKVKIGTGSGASLSATAKATNDTLDNGKLTIEKAFPAGSMGNADDTFSFTVTRNEDTASPKTNYASGKTAKIGSPIVLENLPWGTYTITENTKNGYRLTGWTGGTLVDASDITKGVSVKIGSGSGASLSATVKATNDTKDVGKLTIQKAFPSGSMGNTDDAFSFTVTRNEDTASPKTNYASGKTAKIGSPIVLENLPWGTYTITENPKDGYELTGWSGGALLDASDATKGVSVKIGSGSGASLTATVKATNDTDVGKLTINKAFLDGSVGDSSDTFSFIVTRNEDTASPKTNYAAGKTATIASPIVLEDLPWGTYTITEVAKDGYRLASWTGGTPVDAADATKGVQAEIGTGSGASLSFEVTANNGTDDVGKLTINKAFPEGSMGNADDAFSFIVTRNEDTASPKTNYASGRTAKVGSPIVLENLPWGTYTITEDAKDGYELTGWTGGTPVDASDVTKGVSVKIGSGSGASLNYSLTATNDTAEVGELTIEKAFPEGSLGNADDTFSFTVTRNEDTASPKTNYASGKTAKIGAPIVLGNLPWGTYTITEDAKDGYQLTGWTGGTPVDASDATKGITVTIGTGAGASLTATATATNDTTDDGKLTINKSFLDDSIGDSSDTFSFVVTRDEDTASPKTNYAAGKTATVSSPIVLTDLPWGTYTITESVKDGYRLASWTGGAPVDVADATKGVQVKIGTGSGASLSFEVTANNGTDDVGKLTINKAFPEGSLGDADDTFSFTVTRNEDTASPKTNYASGRTAKVGSPIVLENLPWGTYTITEDAKSGYRLTGWTGGTPVDATDIAKGVSVKIGSGSGSSLNYSLTATNDTAESGELTIQKAFPAGSIGDADDTFSFTVTRNEDTASPKTNYAAGKTAKVGSPIVLTDLPWGTYTVTEDDKSGYRLTGWAGGTPVDASDINKGVTVKIGSGSGASLSYTLTATNDTTDVGQLTIEKAFPDGSMGNADDAFSFTVTRNEDTASPKTNYAAGKTAKVGSPLVLGNLPWGTYTVTEDAKPGYQLTGWKKDGSAVSGSSVTVTIGAGSSAKLEYVLQATNDSDNVGKLTIAKAAFAEGSQGNASDTFSFTVTRQQDAADPITGLKPNYAAGKTTTAGASPIELTGLPWGTYTITENATSGYRLTGWTLDGAAVSGSSVIVTIGSGSSAKLEYALEASNATDDVGRLTIIKSVLGTLQTGDTFRFSVVRDGDSTNKNWAQGITWSAGSLIYELSGLPWGTYTITEDPTDGYRLNDWIGGTPVDTADVTKGVKVTIGTAAGATLNYSVVATNRQLGSLELTKTVDGAADDDPTVFTLKVTGPGGYSQDVTLTNGQTATLSGLEWGEYAITETAVPEGYASLSGTVNFTVGYDTAGTLVLDHLVTYENQKLAAIHILKTDSATGLPVANVTLEISKPEQNLLSRLWAAVFGETWTVTTGADGIADVSNLQPGIYEVKEVSAPDGYVIDPTPKTVTLAAGQTAQVTFENVPQGWLKLIKTDAVTGAKLAGAVFSLADNEDFTDAITLATAADGTVTSAALTPGTWYAKETLAPAGYVLDSTVHTVTVELGKTAEVALLNDPQSFLKIIKTDADTGAALAGAEFSLADNEDFTGAITLTTTADGTVTSAALTSGTWYVRETKAPAGYVLDSTVHTVTVALGKTAEVALTNSAVPGQLQLLKVNAEDGMPLEDAAFNIYSDEALTDLVASDTTDENGEINVDNLTPGTYWVLETRAPENFILNDTAIPVTITANNRTVLTLTNQEDDTGGFEDELGQLNLLKVDGYTQKPLANAKFNLYADEALRVLVATGVTGADGIIEFKDLEPGTYYLVETSAPMSYKLNTTPIDVDVPAGEITEITVTNELDDTKDYQTGSMDYNILLGGGAALLVGAMLIMLTRRRRFAMGRPAMAVSNRRRRPYRTPKH